MNVILIVCDDFLIDGLGDQAAGFITTYMPWLAGRPDGNWVRFTNSYVHQPVCGPGRAALLTGRYSRNSGVTDNNAVGDEKRWLPVALRRASVTTGLFGKYLNTYATNTGIPIGWDRWFGRGSSGSYLNYNTNDQGTSVSNGGTDADYSVDVDFAKAIAWINTIPPERPFFCYIAPTAPHGSPDDPVPATRHTSLYPGATPARRSNFNEADISDKPAWLQTDIPNPIDSTTLAAWDQWHMNGLRSLRAVDEGMEDLRDALNTKGILNNTVIIFVPDNGNSYGEHRIEGRGKPYQEMVNVPIWIRYPGATQADKSYLISNVDIAPTIAAIFNTRLLISSDGMSLLPLISGNPSDWRTTIWIDSTPGTSARPPWDCIIASYNSTYWKYIEYHDTGEGQTELYDLTNDTYELVNRTSDAGYTSTKNELVRRLSVIGL